MNKKHLYLLAGALAGIGIILFLYKWAVMDFPLVPETTTRIWDIEAHLTFEADNSPITVSLAIPQNSHRYAILNENFVSRGHGFSTSFEDGKRQVQWSIRQAQGIQSFYYRASVVRMDRDLLSPKPPKSIQEIPDLKGAYLEASKALVTEVRDKSADTDSLVTGILQRLNSAEPGDSTTLLLGQKPTVQKKVDLAVQLLALAGIHARAVHGIRLETRRREAPILHWLEIYVQDRWIPYEPVAGRKGVPEDYLAWWRGMRGPVQAQGAKNLRVALSVVRGEEAALRVSVHRGVAQKPFLLSFSFFTLPVEIQAVYRVLLLVPLGVLFLVVLRNVIGLRTFGTFMPVLIGLSFRETQLVWGVILFTTLIGSGLLIRFYLEQLKLLVVPRLAAILIVVIGLMALLSVLTHKLGLDRGTSIALFPMVILAMTIERMSIVWEELGAYEAIKQGTGSLIAAALAYLIMSIKTLEHLLFVFPEILLIILAATILLGRYSGFRLLELRRFRALADIQSDV